MAKFFYKAKKGIRESTEGYIEADTEYTAVSKLSQMGLYPLKIEREADLAGSTANLFLGISGKVGTKEMAVFTQQFSDLLASGLTLIRALNVLYDQTESRALRPVLQDVIAQVKDGVSLSAAFSKHPKVFSDFFVSMVNSGEVGGALEEVFKGLSAHYEKEEDLKSKIQTATAYPIFVVVAGAATVFILFSFVIPRLTSIFEEFGQQLPLPTRVLMSISGFFSQFWWLILSFAAAAVFLLFRLNDTKQGKLQIDRFILSLPLLGGFVKKVEIGRLAKSLATLLDNGVPMLRAIDVVSATSTNGVLKEEFEKLGVTIKNGKSFSGAVRESGSFPEFVKNMVAVGEEGGTLEAALRRVGDSYEHDADRIVRIMTSLIEPVLILGVGAVVALIVAAMLLPIFELNLLVK